MARNNDRPKMPPAALAFRAALAAAFPDVEWFARDDLTEMYSHWVRGTSRPLLIDVGPCPEHAGFLVSLSLHGVHRGGVWADLPPGHPNGEFHGAFATFSKICPYLTLDPRTDEGLVFEEGWPANDYTTRHAVMQTGVMLAAAPHLVLAPGVA